METNKQNKSECCEKCNMRTFIKRKGVEFENIKCGIPTCPCHTQSPQEEKSKCCKAEILELTQGLYCRECRQEIFPQKKDTSWEERFDELIIIEKPKDDRKIVKIWCEYDRDTENYTNKAYTDGEKETLKDFISKEISKAREETISSVIEEIEGMKEKYIKLNKKHIGGFEDEIDTCKKITTLLKQKIN